MQKIFSLLLLSCAFSLYAQETLQLQIEDTQKLPLGNAVVHFVGKHFISDADGKVTIKKTQQGLLPYQSNLFRLSRLRKYCHHSTLTTSCDCNERSSERTRRDYRIRAYNSTVCERLNPFYHIHFAQRNSLIDKQGDDLAKVLTSISGVSMIQTGATIAVQSREFTGLAQLDCACLYAIDTPDIEVSTLAKSSPCLSIKLFFERNGYDRRVKPLTYC
ncbi:Uncharacterised protein [Capnocytophaga ochracea]|uniref:TonB-linked outer membrane protein, SusC/RagA family n=1 Tax=Capnocytophaga ochracea TaxID=1018 RepID=A0A2X2SPV2_CAPOC|nr:hypothetical protein [Capnocytophaga ochracea]SQA94328.1 Uncharacterised protein [Capnocytophaga ochracea]